ncbi:MAG: glycosyltransferase family 39 protein, partial [Desulfobacteraceae bacterium]|nr:glycosyltransferase family 39 protein [Desulfobacteraceae bacterium]
PVSRDALTHHLAVPQIYLRQGISELPWLKFSYYPMNLELLYAIPLKFGNDILPKYMHFSFALFTAALLYYHLRRRLNDRWGLFGVLLFLSLPVIFKLSISAYVDLGLVFFSFAAILSLLLWVERDLRWGYLLLAAVSCGLALGIKYNGLIVWFLLTLLVLGAADRCKRHPISEPKAEDLSRTVGALTYAMVFFFVAGLLFSPWMVRNSLWTGNPIYPLFDGLFVSGTHREASSLSHFVLRNQNYGETWWEIALIPIRIFFQGQDGNPKFFDGRLNPYLFFLPAAAFMGYRQEPLFLRIEKAALTVFAIFFILLAFFLRDMRIRYLAPIIPPLVVLSVYGARNGVDWIRKLSNPTWRKIGFGAAVLAVVAGIGLNAAYIIGQFQIIRPVEYLLGGADRHAYIERHRPVYPVFRYANAHIPEPSRILGLFLGDRGYYLQREIVFRERIFKEAVENATSFEDVASHLKHQKFTHLIIRQDLFYRWIDDNFDEVQKERLRHFMERGCRMLFFRNGYGLFQIL